MKTHKVKRMALLAVITCCSVMMSANAGIMLIDVDDGSDDDTSESAIQSDGNYWNAVNAKDYGPATLQDTTGSTAEGVIRYAWNGGVLQETRIWTDDNRHGRIHISTGDG